MRKIKQTGLPKSKEGVSYIQTLCYYRTQRKITQAALVEKSGVALSRIAQMERGELPVVDKESARLSRVMNAPIEDLSHPQPFFGTFEERLQNIHKREQTEWEMGELPGKPRRPVGYCSWCKKCHMNQPCNPLDLPEEVR